MGRGAVEIHQASYDPSVAGLRDAMSHNDFDDAWAQGAALTTAEASATRERGRGERKRASSGWESLTRPNSMSSGWSPTGLATRTSLTTLLLTSDRASHLTHAYTKLGLTPHVQLAQEPHATLTQAFSRERLCTTVRFEDPPRR